MIIIRTLYFIVRKKRDGVPLCIFQVCIFLVSESEFEYFILSVK